jgi:hypothetical protein
VSKWAGAFGLRGWVRIGNGFGLAWKPRWDALMFSQRHGYTRVWRVGPFYVWKLTPNGN